MINVIMAIVTILLVLGLAGNLVLFGSFTMIGNEFGVNVCLFIFVLYLGIILGCVYFYNLDKCDKYENEKKYFEGEIDHLKDDIEWYERQLKSYKKLDKYAKEHNDYELKQSELEEENKKLKSIIRSQNNIKAEDLDQYLKTVMEDKNE